MAELAVNMETGTIHSVTEIAFSPSLIDTRWRCLSCEKEVFPAAHLRSDHDVDPYFRANEPHRECVQDAFGSAGYGRGALSAGIPDRLVLRGTRVQGAEREGDVLEAEAMEPDVRASRSGAGVNEAPQVVVGSLHPLALVHSRKLDVGDRPIRVLDWPASTSRYTFKQLRDNVALEGLAERRIFYADIRFNHPVVNEDSITITLDARSDDAHRTRLTASFSFRGLPQSTRQAISATVQYWVAKQMKLQSEKKGGAIRLYFIGIRNETVFNIPDPRLFSFVEM